MLMVIPNQGKAYFLSRALALAEHYDVTNFNVRLYTNDYTPVDASTFDSFDPASFTGFAPVVIYAADWDFGNVVADVAICTSATTPIFTCTGGSPQTCYGWWMSDQDDNFAVAAQRFDTPRVMGPGAVESLDPFALKLKTFA